jgi:hypothetical protein
MIFMIDLLYDAFCYVRQRIYPLVPDDEREGIESVRQLNAEISTQILDDIADQNSHRAGVRFRMHGGRVHPVGLHGQTSRR